MKIIEAFIEIQSQSMVFSPINFIYFLIVIPVVLGIGFLLWKLKEKENTFAIIIGLSLLLFFVRIMLVVFQTTIGVMPYILPDIVFYTILMVFGVSFCTIYLYKIENKSLQDIGFNKENLLRDIGMGFLGFLPLIAMFPLLLFLTGIEILLAFTWEKIVIGIVFGLILGGYYEEVIFRGVIQDHVNELCEGNEIKTMFLTSLIFVATHLFYLPFTGFGIMYVFIFVMAMLLSYLRIHCSQVSCAILHGGIVFILVLFI